MRMYTMLIWDTNAVFIDQLPTSHADIKSAYCAGIKIFSNLPSDLKCLVNEKAWFKVVLKWYLNTHSFYSVDEYILPRKQLIYL
jgi:hypothetical protein